MKPLKKYVNAVVKTIKMWEWLRDNPDKEKVGYFHKFDLSYEYTEEKCYLCYYWIDSAKYNNCGECPLSNKNHRCCKR